MNVPNHEKKAFRDMTPEERIAIVEAWLAGNAEMYVGDGDWMYVTNFDADIAYRTRPRQLVIPWEHIKEEYRWAVMDKICSIWVYTEKPEFGVLGWDRKGIRLCIDALIIDTTGIDWRESLTARPEGV